MQIAHGVARETAAQISAPLSEIRPKVGEVQVSCFQQKFIAEAVAAQSDRGFRVADIRPLVGVRWLEEGSRRNVLRGHTFPKMLPTMSTMKNMAPVVICVSAFRTRAVFKMRTDWPSLVGSGLIVDD